MSFSRLSSSSSRPRAIAHSTATVRRHNSEALKVLRAAIRKLADGETIETPPTIENPQSLDLIAAALAKRDRRTAPTNTVPA